jgi:hypothetical protein
MSHIIGHDRSQMLLLPEAVDDYVSPDNPVRFIDAFVDGLDLAATGFVGVAPKATGRPGYAPADLLKLYIYGYLNRPALPQWGHDTRLMRFSELLVVCVSVSSSASTQAAWRRSEP